MTEEEVTIPKAWLETLMKYAEQVDTLKDDPANRECSVAALLGYISSAETILQYKSNTKS